MKHFPPSPSSHVHQTKLIECCLKHITTHFYCKICDEKKKKKDNLIKKKLITSFPSRRNSVGVKTAEDLVGARVAASVAQEKKQKLSPVTFRGE